MFQTTYQLLTFFDSVEKIRGRKKLQKIIHLLKRSGTEFPFIYRYHHYGPYSSHLQAEMDQLVTQGYLNVKFKNGAYEYTITDHGQNFKSILETDGGLTFSLDKSLLLRLAEQDTQFLEMFSTYVFLIESGNSEEQAKEKAVQLKPHLKEWMDKVTGDYEALLQ